MRFLLFPLFWLTVSAGKKVEYFLEINRQILAPDGVPKNMLTFNNQFPGPSLRAKEGEELIIHVKNNLNVSTSIHWHGIFQKLSPQMDGASMLTQCPILPGENYTYRFQLHNQSGTFWYHSHVHAQYIQGLVGPLIIEPAMKSTLFHHEYTLLLSDNYHSRIDSIIANFFRVGGDGEEPIPDSGLINGNGRVDCNIYGKKYCNKGKLTKVVFQRGKKYLIRLINTSGFSSFRFSIDDHKLIVVEVDGIRIKPKVVKSLQINVAQRYGVIVKAYSKFRGPFAIRSVMQTECFASTLPNSTNPFIFASLRYGNTSNETVLETSVETNSVEFPHKIPSRLRYPKSEESINETVCDHLIEDQIVPMQLVPKELKSPDVTKTFEVNIGPDQKNISRGYINNITFVSPSYPPLFTLINGKPISYVPSSIHPIFIPLNNVVRFIINNKDDGEHPFHFHGHVCSILGRGKGIFDPVKDEKKLNKINPLRRDTFTLTGGGWLVLQFYSDNLGVWLFHCHIEWHMLAGLSMTVITGADSIKDLKLNDLKLCPINKN